MHYRDRITFYDKLKSKNSISWVSVLLMGILALITIAVWFKQINEFNKPKEKQNNRQTILLTSFGSLLTLVLTVDFFKNFLA